MRDEIIAVIVTRLDDSLKQSILVSSIFNTIISIRLHQSRFCYNLAQKNNERMGM